MSNSESEKAIWDICVEYELLARHEGRELANPAILKRLGLGWEPFTVTIDEARQGRSRIWFRRKV